MRITLEEIVTELKANYGLEEYTRSLNPASFEPIFGFKFKDRKPIIIKNVLTLIEDFYYYENVNEMLHIAPPPLTEWTRKEKVKELCKLISTPQET